MISTFPNSLSGISGFTVDRDMYTVTEGHTFCQTSDKVESLYNPKQAVLASSYVTLKKLSVF